MRAEHFKRLRVKTIVMECAATSYTNFWCLFMFVAYASQAGMVGSLGNLSSGTMTKAKAHKRPQKIGKTPQERRNFGAQKIRLPKESPHPPCAFISPTAATSGYLRNMEWDRGSDSQVSTRHIPFQPPRLQEEWPLSLFVFVLLF